MELGMIGLGRMGANMAQRLLSGGHRVAVYDINADAVAASRGHGAVATSSLSGLLLDLTAPRAVWIMAPAGEPTESTINQLAELMSPGDIIIDGGNANYKDTLRRAEKLAEKSIRFVDVGTSGGIWGLAEGYSLMVGCDEETFERLEPIFQTLAPGPDRGYGRVGPSGAGHFVKMVHNGVEYGLMQAYAEGFELLEAKDDFGLDIAQISRIWSHGSVVRSWLLELTSRALQENPGMEGIQSFVEDSGEGRWTVQESVDLGVPLPVITASLQARFRSRQDQPFAGKLLAAMRRQFGGHAVKSSD